MYVSISSYETFTDAMLLDEQSSNYHEDVSECVSVSVNISACESINSDEPTPTTSPLSQSTISLTRSASRDAPTSASKGEKGVDVSPHRKRLSIPLSPAPSLSASICKETVEGGEGEEEEEEEVGRPSNATCVNDLSTSSLVRDSSNIATPTGRRVTADAAGMSIVSNTLTLTLIPHTEIHSIIHLRSYLIPA